MKTLPSFLKSGDQVSGFPMPFGVVWATLNKCDVVGVQSIHEKFREAAVL